MDFNAKNLISTNEVAKYLGISYSTVRRLVYDGSLTAYKIRGKIRFSIDEVMSYIESTRI
jgi:excisionase family DNA binding protein